MLLLELRSYIGKFKKCCKRLRLALYLISLFQLSVVWQTTPKLSDLKQQPPFLFFTFLQLGASLLYTILSKVAWLGLDDHRWLHSHVWHLRIARRTAGLPGTLLIGFITQNSCPTFFTRKWDARKANIKQPGFFKPRLGTGRVILVAFCWSKQVTSYPDSRRGNGFPLVAGV